MTERSEALGHVAGEVENWRELIDHQVSTMHVEAFMAEHDLGWVEMGEALREYRSDCGWSPYADRDTLDADFLNWFKWERIG